MNVVASDSMSNISDSTSKEKNKEHSTPKFSINEYLDKDTQEKIAKLYSKQEVQNQTNINTTTSNQSAVYSIAKAQEQKDKEEQNKQIGESKDRYIENLIGNGYSHEEALKRVSIYEKVGFFSHTPTIDNKVLDANFTNIGFTMLDPSFKPSLFSALEKIDTIDLDAITKEVEERLSMTNEEYEHIMMMFEWQNPLLSSSSDDSSIGSYGNYWSNKFDLSQKFFGLLDSMSSQTSLIEKFSGDDLSDLKNEIETIKSKFLQTFSS